MADLQTQDTLKQAYAHIKQGDKSAAIRLIKPVLRQDRDNAAAWWLLANAAPKPEQAKQALHQVLRLKPGDEKAQKMLTRIEMRTTPSAPPVRGSDPFAVLDGEPAPPLSRRMRDEIDTAFESDDLSGDPFADDDPFAGVSAPSRASSSPLPADAYSGSYNASSAARNNQILVYVIAGIGAVMGVVLGGFVLTSLDSLGGGSNGRLSASPLQGTCVVAPEDAGYFSENVVIDCGRIALDQRWNGEISAYQSHDWYLEAEAGQSIRIDVESVLDDPMLAIYGPDGRMIAENDDIEYGENTDSRLELTLMQSGTYRIHVEMYFDNGGQYQIDLHDTGSVAAADITGCRNLSQSQTDSGETAIRCGEVSVSAVISETLPADGIHEWRLIAEPGQRVTVEMNAMYDDLDPYLNIYRDDGSLLTSNDDIASFDNYDSRVVFTVPESGWVIISAEQFGWGGGAYSLTIR